MSNKITFLFLTFSIACSGVFADSKIDLEQYLGDYTYSQSSNASSDKVVERPGAAVTKDRIYIEALNAHFTRYIFFSSSAQNGPARLTIYRSETDGKYYSFLWDAGYLSKEADFKSEHIFRPGESWIELKESGNTLKGVFYPGDFMGREPFKVTFEKDSVKVTGWQMMQFFLIPYPSRFMYKFDRCKKLLTDTNPNSGGVHGIVY